MTTLDEFNQWLAAPRETANLEFKEAATQYDNTKLFRHCVALANEGGGKLILGVTDKPPRRIKGTGAFHIPAGIQSKILDKLRFRVDVEEFLHPDGRVLIFHIPARPRGTAYSLDGAYFMRSPDGTTTMSEDRLRRIFDEGKPDWLMRAAMSDCTPDDVLELLDTRLLFKLLGQSYPTHWLGVIRRFENEKLLQDEGDGKLTITNLGAMLFANRLDRFEGLARKAPRVITYEGTDKLDAPGHDAVGIKGYVPAFEPLIDFINTRIPTNEVIEKAFRREVKMFPSEAIRELVANALIHQDFNETGTSVMIEIFADRIEISNPGLPIIPLDRFADGIQSRNETLAGLTRRLGMCEEQGLGIDRVLKSVEVYQLPAPDLRTSERQTKIVLFAHKKFEDMDRNERIQACYWHCVLMYVTNQKMNNASLRDRFDLPETKLESVSAVITDTVHAGKIKTADPKSTSRRYANYLPSWA